MKSFIAVAVLALLSSAIPAWAQPAEMGPYKLLKVVTVGGQGGWDYLTADTEDRKLFIPRTGRADARVEAYDLDTLKPLGNITGARGVHGVAIDPKNHHGFASSNPVIMFDTTTLATLKQIKVDGRPDGILFDPQTSQVYVLSHSQPNVTILNTSDGSIAGTIDLGGAPEESAVDGNGHLYSALEDKSKVAVVDLKTKTVTATYELGGADGPSGLALDAKNGVIFAFCHNQKAVVLNAADGKILTTLPIGPGVDSAAFNPDTNEAFGSENGELSVIKENSPTSFELEQNVATKPGARSCTLDSKTGQVYLVTAIQGPPTTRPAAAAADQGGQRPRGGRGRPNYLPNSFMILVVGKE